MVTVGRENNGLRFSDVKRGPDGEIWHVWVSLRLGGLNTSWLVSPDYATGFDERGNDQSSRGPGGPAVIATFSLERVGPRYWLCSPAGSSPEQVPLHRLECC
jgi:hypothetical protein